MTNYLIVSLASMLTMFGTLTVISVFLFYRCRAKQSSVDVNISPIELTGLAPLLAREDSSGSALASMISDRLDRIGDRLSAQPADQPNLAQLQIELASLRQAVTKRALTANVPAPEAEVDDPRVSALAEEKRRLCQQVDELRGELAVTGNELKSARADVEYWRRGGDLRIELIDDQLKKLQKSIGRGNTNALINLLTREKAVLELRKFNSEEK